MSQCVYVLAMLFMAILVVSITMTCGEEEEEVYSLTVTFTDDMLDEFHRCLCNGSSSNCIADLQLNELDFQVSKVTHNGTFSRDGTTCRYYICDISLNRETLECQQVDNGTCNIGLFSQFFLNDQYCCGLVCVGLFWKDQSLKNIFEQQLDDGECDSVCLCPNSDTTTETPVSIYLESTNSSNNATSVTVTTFPTNTTVSTTFSINATYEAITIKNNDKTDNILTNNESNNTEFSKSNEEETNKVAVSVAIVGGLLILISAVVLIVLFICRRRRRGRRNQFRGRDIVPVNDSAGSQLISAPISGDRSPASIELQQL